MTTSTFLTMRLNNAQYQNEQMAQMKWIMYIMPIVFMGVLNNYAAGLTYYYFLSNMITLGQQYAIKAFVNEDAIRKRIEENKKKPAKQSNFQKKLEEMAKQSQQQRAAAKKK